MRQYDPSWKAGDWKAICDRCGFVYKSSELRKTWEGLWVCNKDWEERHPQEFVRGVRDTQSVPSHLTRVEGSPEEIGDVLIGLVNPMNGSNQGTEYVSTNIATGIGFWIVEGDVNPFEVLS